MRGTDFSPENQAEGKNITQNAAPTCQLEELWETFVEDPIMCSIASDPLFARLQNEADLTLECAMVIQITKEVTENKFFSGLLRPFTCIALSRKTNT